MSIPYQNASYQFALLKFAFSINRDIINTRFLVPDWGSSSLKKDIKMNKFGFLVLVTSLIGMTTAIAQVPLPAISIVTEAVGPKRVEASGRGDIRTMCFGKQCTEVPYETAIAYQSALLPITVEEAYAKGYGRIEITIKTTAGDMEIIESGGFLINKKNRLVISSLHGLPPYIEQLNIGNITFRDVRARYVGSIPEVDLALFQIEKVPEGMRELPLKEAVVGESVYGRSLQKNLILNANAGKTSLESIWMIGPVSFSGTVATKGHAGIAQYDSRTGKRGFSGVNQTQYQMISVTGRVEIGFSGSPLYNLWGEVVGIVTSVTPGGVTYAVSSKNFPALLELYKGQ